MPNSQYIVSSIPNEASLPRIKLILLKFGALKSLEIIVKDGPSNSLDIKFSFETLKYSRFRKLLKNGLKLKKKIYKIYKIQPLSKIEHKDPISGNSSSGSLVSGPKENTAGCNRLGYLKPASNKLAAIKIKSQLKITQIFNKRLAEFESRFNHSHISNLKWRLSPCDKEARYQRLTRVLGSMCESGVEFACSSYF